MTKPTAEEKLREIEILVVKLQKEITKSFNEGYGAKWIWGEAYNGAQKILEVINE